MRNGDRNPKLPGAVEKLSQDEVKEVVLSCGYRVEPIQAHKAAAMRTVMYSINCLLGPYLSHCISLCLYYYVVCLGLKIMRNHLKSIFPTDNE